MVEFPLSFISSSRLAVFSKESSLGQLSTTTGPEAMDITHQRRYEIINIPRDLCAYQYVCHRRCVPHTVAVLKLKNCGIPLAQIV